MNAPWLTIHELALALKVSVKTVRRAYLRGEISVERLSPQGERRAPGGASRWREATQSPRLVKRGRKFQPSTRRQL